MSQKGNPILCRSVLAAVLIAVPNLLQGQRANSGTEKQSDSGVADLDISQLMNVEVTSASKQGEPLFGAPAAIFVMTSADLQRGGFATLPEALRAVPGLYVAQTDSHIWQVSARGFSDLANNKMLVMVDGRSVYSPDEGTVYWDVLDIPLENIDRVEVIRGPGGTLWGDNAVNGVINIVLKSSEAMQGVLISSTADPETGYGTTVRYGGRIMPQLTYTVFGRASYWEPFQLPTGGTGPDHFGLPQAGARFDWAPTTNDAVSVEGGGYDGRYGSTSFATGQTTTYLLRGNDVVFHWKHTVSDRTSVDTLAYCDWYGRYGAPAERRNTCDLEFQQNHQFTSRQSVIWGASFFSTADNLSNDQVSYFHEKLRTNVYSSFVQYDAWAVPDRVRLLAGVKLEHNDYTGFEYEPQGRAVWTPNRENSLWSAVSKSIRTPARNNSDIDAAIPIGESNGLPIIDLLEGNSHLSAERVFSYEIGYRYQPTPSLAFDLALYYNQYDALIEQALQSSQSLPTEILNTIQYINGPSAQTHGLELGAHWAPVHRWTVQGAVTQVRGSEIAVQATAQQMYSLQSRVELPHKLEFDSAYYYYGSLPLGSSGPFAPPQSVPAFFRLDTGASWHPGSQWSMGVWGRNLQSPGHLETRSTAYRNTGEDIPRSVAFQVVWRAEPENKKRN